MCSNREVTEMHLHVCCAYYYWAVHILPNVFTCKNGITSSSCNGGIPLSVIAFPWKEYRNITGATAHMQNHMKLINEKGTDKVCFNTYVRCVHFIIVTKSVRRWTGKIMCTQFRHLCVSSHFSRLLSCHFIEMAIKSRSSINISFFFLPIETLILRRLGTNLHISIVWTWFIS